MTVQSRVHTGCLACPVSAKCECDRAAPMTQKFWLLSRKWTDALGRMSKSKGLYMCI